CRRWCRLPDRLLGRWLRVEAIAFAICHTATPPGKRWRMASADIGGAFYQAVLHVVLADEGLYVNPWILRFHGPVPIPLQILVECRSDADAFVVSTASGPIRIRLMG